MADTITTDADLMDSGLINASQKRQLTDPRWTDGSWAPRHKNAWSAIKRQLQGRPDAIAESDITDTTELVPAVLHYVLYLAWLAGGDLDKARHHHSQYTKELTSRLTVLGSKQQYGWGRGIPLNRQ